MDSPFLGLPESEHVAGNALAFAIRDAFPVSRGHTLVITRRLVATWFDATDEERAAILALVDVVKRQLDEERHPDGYNVGFNAGAAAGQTVMHLHVHVIPRFRGDMDDPTGGVRHVIPSMGNYRSQHPPLTTGGEADPFARHVLPLLERSTEVSIVAAFVVERGLRRIQPSLEAALRQGARVRLLTGDYLNFTQVRALEMALDWLAAWREVDDGEVSKSGVFEARVVEVERLPGATSSFHPKSWHFEGPEFGVAFVGSSNLSVTALDTGIEWNLRVDRDRDTAAWMRIRTAFDELWERARVLDAEWVEAYAERVRQRALPMAEGEAEGEEAASPPEPHEVQIAALDALMKSRQDGRRRALVVLATGLGKTWLAAFDWRQAWDECGRPPRLLFVAHRREILLQAAGAFRQVLRQRGENLRIGRLSEDKRELDAHLVFASVSKLARQPWLSQLSEHRFDYVVIDEVHHAAAESYRRILGAIDPAFLLGLTATPDRADAADILGLFDENVAYEAGIARGIAISRLVPFHYFGVKDDVDYNADNIPWRNGRFDPERLAQAVQTERRMQTLWKAWEEKIGTRTLVFCCSVAHADFTADWLAAKGVRVAKVYSAPGSDDRGLSLGQLARREIDAICAIDVFNEGVDVPAIDRVVMLRPTESGVVFLQQLGRGLRSAPDKTHLTIIDFVGNHRVFLERLRTLVSLGAKQAAAVLRELVERGEVELPAGCSVAVELEAKSLLEALFRVGGTDEVERAYRELRVARGSRPTAGELQRMGYLPSALRRRHRSWFGWVHSEGDLAADEASAFEREQAFLTDLEVNERMSKSYKMVTLEALVEADALAVGFSVRDLALRCWQILRRAPELLTEVPEDKRLPDQPSEADISRWVEYRRENPINAWTSERRNQRTWFHLDADRLVIDVAVDVDAALKRLVSELVDYRLAAHRSRSPWGNAEGFLCRVTWNKRDSILKLPNRRLHAVPEGDVDVRLPDGSVWLFRFMKEFCNVARPAGTDRNQLMDLLRRWFGPRAGQPGTSFDVRFVASPDGLWVEPVQSTGPVVLSARRSLVAYADLVAAAGHALGESDAPEVERVLLPFDGDDTDLFAVRVAGNSMDGGGEPLRNGDWALLRLCRGASAESLVGRVVLVQVPGVGNGSRYQIKRIVRDERGWQLTSDNPDGPTFAGSKDTVAIARLERALHPEDLAPAVGARFAIEELAGAFGLPALEAKTGRQGVHLFLVLGDQVTLLRPDRLTTVVRPLPGEVGYVLGLEEGGVRYLGVARWITEEEGWELPEQPFEVWRRHGKGRSVSRELPPEALARAARVVDAVLALEQEDRLLVQPSGARARVLGKAQQGGLRVAVGQGERTVSLGDIAWVAVAADDVREKGGGLLDEARVNRMRYLEGTPRASTRWIDTGWALAAWGLGASGTAPG